MVATYDDFTKLEIRTVRITSVEAIEGKTRIALGVIDTGERTMQVIIGGADKFDPTSLIGVQAVAVTNMVPKTIAGITSEAMLLAADVDGVPFWLTPNVILVFSSGKLVCTGAKKEPDVYRSVNYLHAMLEEKNLMIYT